MQAGFPVTSPTQMAAQPGQFIPQVGSVAGLSCFGEAMMKALANAIAGAAGLDQAPPTAEPSATAQPPVLSPEAATPGNGIPDQAAAQAAAVPLADPAVTPAMTTTELPKAPSELPAAAQQAARVADTATPAAVAPPQAILPQPLPSPGAAEASTTQRKGDANVRRRPAQAAGQDAASATIPPPAGPPLAIAPAMPLLVEAPTAVPPAYATAPAIGRADGRHGKGLIDDGPPSVAKPPGDGQPILLAPRLVAPGSTVPEAPPAAAHDVVGATSIVLPAQPSPPAAAELSAPLFQPPMPPPDVSPGAPLSLPSLRAAATPPAAQVAPAIVSMAHAPDGAQRLTLRLEPPELGHVQIRIDRPPEAPARVEITVERAETLTLLLRDQPQLQHALDQAGVPPDGRTVTFHLASQEPGPRSEATPPAQAGMGAGSAGMGDPSNGASRQGSSPGREGFAAADNSEADLVRVAIPGWARAGLDITA